MCTCILPIIQGKVTICTWKRWVYGGNVGVKKVRKIFELSVSG
jgi:hypothetical protein